VPSLEGLQPDGQLEQDEHVLHEAVARNQAANHGQQPFMLSFRLLHPAFAEKIVGAPTRAVIELATAVETLLSRVIQVAGPLAGRTEAQLDAAQRASLRNRITDHLGPLLQVSIDWRRRAQPALPKAPNSSSATSSWRGQPPSACLTR
jgi:hypothetical protein